MIGKLAYDHIMFRGVSLEEETMGENNGAMAVSFSGFITGLGVALSSVVDPGLPLYVNMMAGAVAIFLVLFTTKVFDWVFLLKIDLAREITRKRNKAAGTIEGAFALSTGFIVSGAFSGEASAQSVVALYGETLLYCLAGTVFAFLSTLVLSFFLGLSLQDEARKGNTAVAVAFGGLFVAVANIVRHVISGPSVGTIINDLVVTLEEFLLGLGLMMVFFIVFDYAVFRRFKFSDELKEPNLSVGFIMAGIFVACSIFSTALLP